MLTKRLQSALLILGCLIALIVWVPDFSPLIPLVLVLILGWGLLEFYALLAAAGMSHHRYTGLAGGVLLVVTTWFAQAVAPAWSPALPALLVILIALSILLLPGTANPLVSLAGTILGFVYVGWLGNFLTLLILLPGWGSVNDGRWLLLFLVAVVKFSDVSAYFTGSRWGRHKLMARVSPAKTWEGAAGGLAGGLLAALLWWVLSGRCVAAIEVRFTQILLLGLLLPLAGLAGDLVESMIKRSCEVKDSGQVFQGMGGLLDVIDSLIFSAPILYFFMRWILMQG